jgi:iron complex transport system substrate-binding protein
MNTFHTHSNSLPERTILDPAITSIDRSILHQALSGDFQLMARLIADWDIDAQILDSRGFEGIKRIDRSDFLHSQSLIRILQNKEAAKQSSTFLRKHNYYVVDDTGCRIDLNQSFNKFLPQSYAAASLLLSLVPPDQIAALPRSLREQTHLYPEALTNQIPLDIDRYNSEKLFQAKPEVAFVAHYSHPATIQALTNQGVLLYTMRNIKTLPDISEELTHMGCIINKPLEAELMNIFIDAAIAAIDNQQSVLIHHFKQSNEKLPRVLVVNFHQSFSVPTTNSLTGQILSHMQSLDISLDYAMSSDQADEWMAPINKERLRNLNPDYLIIATENEEALAKEIRNDKALQEISAIRNNRLIFVDEAILHSPSQYVVLAYHNLIQALASVP